MKILQVHNRYRDPGGEDLVVEREAEALREAGHDVVQYSTTNLVSVPATISSLALAPWNTVAASRMEHALRTLDPDVVHFHNTWFRLSSSVINAASKRGVPTVMTLHNYRPLCANGQFLRDGRPCEDCITIGTKEAIRHRCYKGSFATTMVAVSTQALARRRQVWTNDVDRYIALTTFAQSTFVRGGFPHDRIVVEPNRISDPGPRTTPASTSNRVLFVGRLDTLKGVDRLCEQWTRSDTQLKLTLVGSGPIEVELQRSYPNIDFLGQQSQVQVSTLMHTARAIVVPSVWYEGLPNVLVEALARGLPPIASSTMAVTADLADIGTDWSLDVDSEADWARAIRLLADDTEVDRASIAARAVFIDKYQADAAEALTNVYESAIDFRRSRPTTGEA